MFEKEFNIILKDNNVYLKQGTINDNERSLVNILVFNSENKLYHNNNDDWLLVEIILPNTSDYGEVEHMVIKDEDKFCIELNKVETYIETYMYTITNEVNMDYYTVFIPRSKLAELIFKLFDFSKEIKNTVVFEPNNI